MIYSILSKYRGGTKLDKAMLYIWKKGAKKRLEFTVKNAKQLIDIDVKQGDVINIENLGTVNIAGSHIDIKFKGEIDYRTLNVYALAEDGFAKNFS